jgi:hypothetical protein
MVLATWRLASLFVSEDGLFNVFRRIRSLTGVSHHDDGTVAQIPDKTLPKLFTCLWCMSLWTAVVVYVLWIYAPFLVWILGLSTGGIIVERVRGG